MRQGEAERARRAAEPEPEPEPEGEVFATNIRAFGPDDEHARRLRWFD
jgi:hypothetical protein